MECIKIKNLYLFTNRYHLKSAEVKCRARENTHNTHATKDLCPNLFKNYKSRKKHKTQ